MYWDGPVTLSVARASFFARPVEAAAKNALDDPVIGGRSCADADAEVDLPLWADVEVDAWKNLLLLLVHCVGVAEVAVVGVVLDGPVDFLGEIVADGSAGGKIDAEINVGAVPGAFEGGIDGEVPAAELLVDNGANLPCPGVRGKEGALVADLVGETNSDGPMPILGDAHARADVVADPLHAEAALLRGEDVEADFGPIGKALRDLYGLMFGVVGGCDARSCEMADRSVVGVKLNHCGVGRDGFRSIDLNLVVALCAGERDGENGK